MLTNAKANNRMWLYIHTIDRLLMHLSNMYRRSQVGFKTLIHFDIWQQMSMLSVCSELNANISPGWPPTKLALALAMKQNNPSAMVKRSILEDPEPQPESPLYVQPNLPEILCTEVHAVESPASQFATGPEDNATVAAILLLSDSRKTTTGRGEEGSRKNYFFFFFYSADNFSTGGLMNLNPDGSNPILRRLY